MSLGILPSRSFGGFSVFPPVRDPSLPTSHVFSYVVLPDLGTTSPQFSKGKCSVSSKTQTDPISHCEAVAEDSDCAVGNGVSGHTDHTGDQEEVPMLESW